MAYAAASQLTITLNSLSNNSARQSAVLDNTSNLYTDILIGGGFKTASGSLGSNPVVNVWAAAITDGTNYGGSNGSNTLGGGDAAFAMPSNTGNLVLLASVPINASAATEYMEPRSLAAAFGGTTPPKVVIIVQNSTGLALDSSAGGTIYDTGVNTTTA
jgi:hypothetical protein